MNIAIVDYGLGNINSLVNAFEHFGERVTVTSDNVAVLSSDAIVLPGVGAFEDGIGRLKSLGLISTIRQFAEKNKPLLGVCLGMQLLMESSEEFGYREGLGIIKGRVRSFHNFPGFRKATKVPHIGWNDVLIKKDSPIVKGIEKNVAYFVHSYCVTTEDPKDTVATTIYGNVEFSSIVNKDSVYGCQFHPEKSSTSGLKIISNFIEIAKGGL